MSIKTKLYTKQQIQEAIAFWTKILENTSPFIDALVEEFGYDVVFGNRKIVPSLKIIENIYHMLNTYAFDNQLAICPIEKDIDGLCVIDNAAMEYCYTLYTDKIEHPTKYVLLTQAGKDKNGNVFCPPKIIIADETLSSSMSLMSLISMIAHEMIHQHMIEVGDDVQKQFEADYVTHEQYDEHNIRFEKMMDQLNAAHGLNICKSGSKNTYDKDIIDALKNFVGSDYAMNESTQSTNTMKVVSYDSGYINIRLM